MINPAPSYPRRWMSNGPVQFRFGEPMPERPWWTHPRAPCGWRANLRYGFRFGERSVGKILWDMRSSRP
jgi:hypothetical protein